VRIETVWDDINQSNTLSHPACERGVRIETRPGVLWRPMYFPSPGSDAGWIETPVWYTLPSVSLASRASDNELKLAMKAQAQNLRYGKFANIAKLEFETCVSLPSGEINRPP
jgi:hypothetical protein